MSQRRPACLLAAALLLATAACTERGDDRAQRGAPVVDVEAASPTSVVVSWAAPADAHRWLVVLSSAEGRNLGQRTACGSCREVAVEHLAPGSEYAVRVFGVDGSGTFGAFSEPVTARTPAAPTCGAAPDGATCVAVDLGAVGEEALGVGLGGLHGVTSGTDPAAVTALEPRNWRVAAGDVERFSLARAFGARVTVLLSDAWIMTVGLRAPWADWAAYDAFIGQIVDAYVAAGTLPDFWEVQNEPAVDTYEGDPATVELLVEQHRRAAAQIHRRLPDAVVLGPAAAYVTFGTGLGDAERFAALAADGTLGGISWHEIGGGCLDRCDASPRAVLQHADDVRAALDAAGAAAELHVDEWGAPWNIGQPGAIVGYLASMATGEVDAANPTCWPARAGEDEPTCRVVPGTLGGLLLDDGRTPTDAWYAHVAYAGITGPGFRLLDATVADPQASVVATIGGGGVVRALLGRHTGCDRAVDEHCPSDVSYAPAEEVSLVLDGADGSYRVTVERIESTTGASRGPVALDPTTATAAGGRLVVGPWRVEDGEALLMTLTAG